MLRLTLLAFCFPVLLAAQNDRSLSPYFEVNVDSGETVPDFPLKSTGAEVEIAGVIADVTVTQVYVNRSARPLEAVYVFPGSTNAAVYAMEMQIGRRTVTAEIREKQEARQEYNEAKAQGKTASLLEQQRPNIFTMNVANIMPGDSIVVRMSYTERLVPTEGVYEFVYPTVVGPRYTGAGAPIASNRGMNIVPEKGIPYTPKGVKPGYAFDMNVNISSCIPFEFIRSTSHKVLLSFTEKNAATVLLDSSEADGGNRDFILQYRFAGGQIETGLMLYEGKDENFFMLMMQPPARVPVDSIPPREYIFVMDVSGSMSGYPLETAKKLLTNLVSGLRPTDKFNVVQFAGGASLFSEESVQANQANIDSALVFISTPQGSGGTELNAAMRTAMFIPKAGGCSRSIVIVTDGLITAEPAVLRSMRNHLDSANVFAFGIGNSSNRYLIEAMAFAGNGEPFTVTQANEADSAAERFRRYISSPVLTNIHITYDGFDAYDVEPTAVPDLFADRPLVITGKYRGKPSGKIVVNGVTGAGPYTKIISADSVHPRKQNKAIRLLWARDRVKFLSYLDDPRLNYYAYGYTNGDTTVQSEITALGLKYGILTNYTSFLAVDRKVRNKNPEGDSTVVEPAPLPQGMDNSAVGMTGTLQEVTITSFLPVIDASYSNIVSCDIKSIACCVVLQVRPVLPVHSHALLDPMTVSDLNWYTNGGFVNPVVSNKYNPFFSPGASGRMSAMIPTDMISWYSSGPPLSHPGNALFAPNHSACIGLNSTNYGKNRLTLSGTQKGNQNLSFSKEWSHNEHYSSMLEIGEQWKPLNIDRNNDAYADATVGAGVSAHHYFGYYGDYNESTHLYHASNDLFFHWSDFSGGRMNAGNWQTNDHAMGIYSAPEFQFRVNSYDNFYLKSSVGHASIENKWDADRFHLNTTSVAVSAEYEHVKNRLEYNFGVSGSMATGEERWNHLRFNSAYNGGNAFFKVEGYKNSWNFIGNVTAAYDNINGGIILPSAEVRFSPGGVGIRLYGTRYRSEPFAVGQLLPLLYSSRSLDVSENPGPNQGWYVDASMYYFHGQWSMFGGYILVAPEQTVIMNADANANQLLVYGVKGGPLQHRFKGNIRFTASDHLLFDAEYVASFCAMNYSGETMQQPLLPKHKAYASATWTSKNYGFSIVAQECYTGSQRLPQHGMTPAYFTTNLKMLYQFRSQRVELFVNAFNLFDYRQQTQVYTTGDVNTQYDGWMNWAPVQGRVLQFGATLKF